MAEVVLQSVQVLLLWLFIGVPDNMFDRFRSVQDVRERLDEGGVQEDSVTFSLHNRMRQSFLAQGIIRSNDGQRLGSRTVRHRQPV